MIRKLRESQQECDSIVKHVIEALFSKRIIKLVKTTVKYLSNVEFDRTNAEENEITRCFKFVAIKIQNVLDFLMNLIQHPGHTYNTAGTYVI